MNRGSLDAFKASRHSHSELSQQLALDLLENLAAQHREMILERNCKYTWGSVFWVYYKHVFPGSARTFRGMLGLMIVASAALSPGMFALQWIFFFFALLSVSDWFMNIAENLMQWCQACALCSFWDLFSLWHHQPINYGNSIGLRPFGHWHVPLHHYAASVI